MSGMMHQNVISVTLYFLFVLSCLQMTSVLSARYSGSRDMNVNQGKRKTQRLQPLIRFRGDTYHHPASHPEFKSTQEEEIRTASVILPLDEILLLLRKMRTNSIATDTYTVRSIYYGIK
ncbi:uncharacterized protein LOC111051404 isoform X2 [Nilaparvata lugens]|uniref:uncharacterized protein LOC111051404 isoform X2 n=1 Tax=Nilaparvata lugens TaxID=108931 RepID=UPI00193D3FCC|nr:uncharacterized protein LOC111051404 isoform X2 [Nilaparvata lugens]